MDDPLETSYYCISMADCQTSSTSANLAAAGINSETDYYALEGYTDYPYINRCFWKCPNDTTDGARNPTPDYQYGNPVAGADRRCYKSCHTGISGTDRPIRHDGITVILLTNSVNNVCLTHVECSAFFKAGENYLQYEPT